MSGEWFFALYLFLGIGTLAASRFRRQAVSLVVGGLWTCAAAPLLVVAAVDVMFRDYTPFWIFLWLSTSLSAGCAVAALVRREPGWGVGAPLLCVPLLVVVFYALTGRLK